MRVYTQEQRVKKLEKILRGLSDLSQSVSNDRDLFPVYCTAYDLVEKLYNREWQRYIKPLKD